MPTTTANELSLINDSEFLEELQQVRQPNARGSNLAPEPRTAFSDGFSGLDRGLPVDADAPQAAALHDEPAPIGNPYDADEVPEPLVSTENRIPFIAAALVLIACLAAGAATAAFLFHDPLAPVTSAQPANR